MNLHFEQDKDDNCAVPLRSRKEKLQALRITMHHLDVSKTKHLRIFHSMQKLQMEIRSEWCKQSIQDDNFSVNKFYLLLLEKRKSATIIPL